MPHRASEFYGTLSLCYSLPCCRRRLGVAVPAVLIKPYAPLVSASVLIAGITFGYAANRSGRSVGLPSGQLSLLAWTASTGTGILPLIPVIRVKLSLLMAVVATIGGFHRKQRLSPQMAVVAAQAYCELCLYAALRRCRLPGAGLPNGFSALISGAPQVPDVLNLSQPRNSMSTSSTSPTPDTCQEIMEASPGGRS